MDQLAHLLKMTPGAEQTPFRYGHVASYDPTLNRVRCIIPSMTDQDGNPLLSPWMPMPTAFSGAGYGIQVIPFGGASVQNPTAGEQVVIGTFDRQRGVSAVVGMYFDTTTPPPANSLPTTQNGYSAAAAPVAAGDVIISAPPQQSGGSNSVIRMRQNGNIEIWAAAQANVDVIGDINITTETGNATITVTQGSATVSATQGTVNILGGMIQLGKAIGDALLQLCNSAFWANFNLHTHDDGGPPNEQADQTTLTQTVTAE